MAYEPAFHPDVAQELRSLDKAIKQRVLDKIRWLLEIPHKPLTAQWKGMYRLRVGDWRVIYEIDREHRRVIFYAVGRRREVYNLR